MWGGCIEAKNVCIGLLNWPDQISQSDPHSQEHRRKKDRSFVKKACFKAALQLLLGREERERERETAAHSLCSSLGCNLHGFLHNYPHLRVSWKLEINLTDDAASVASLFLCFFKDKKSLNQIVLFSPFLVSQL